MNISALEKFAQNARRQLKEQIAAGLEKVLTTDSAELREKEKALSDLKHQIGKSSKESVVDRVAYIWFNRFCAIRFMDVNRYTRIGIVSPQEGFTQPDILAEAKQGHIDDSFERFVDRQKVIDLLSGNIPSRDPQQEAYRLLLVAVCNYYSDAMPFLFEKIADYTELLMPDDLLSENSIISSVRKALTADTCKDVEVIGWLYQFYISEKKDEVFAKLGKGKKIAPEDIPSATQLFTPHWIVRYLVENSLGRLWMLNKPNSKLVEKMDYYIKPDQEEADFLKISSPEEIKICDPACGSGHMLTYAFDLLYSIYEEEGYEPTQIPFLILEKNLFGIEIDERAGELAAFALTMKAREKYRRFFSKPIQPNICILENIDFEEGELKAYMDEVGSNLFTANLLKTLYQFKEANNFGSLIKPEISDITPIFQTLEDKNIAGNLFLSKTHEKAIKALMQADYLSSKYHVVIANPPYMGGGGINGCLKSFASDNYPNSKSDLFAMFIERNIDLAQKQGMVAMITMQSWMFLSSFEKIRGKMLDENTIRSMAHLGARAFDTVGGEVVSTTAFVIDEKRHPDQKGNFLRLIDGRNEAQKKAALKASLPTDNNPLPANFYRASAADFKKIPGSPIAYWMSDRIQDIFLKGNAIGSISAPRKGNTTTDNARFLRFWPEVDIVKSGFNCRNRDEAVKYQLKWIPYNKGGGYRKWYGFNEFLINWYNDGEEIKEIPHSVIANEQFFFLPGLTWSTVTSGKFSLRRFGFGFIFDNGGCCIFGDKPILDSLLNFMNSKIFVKLFSEINPTLNFQSGDIARVPFLKTVNQPLSVNHLVDISISDWDSYETSWNFIGLPLLRADFFSPDINIAYLNLHKHWQKMIDEMHRLEEENNRIFIEAYGLQDELTPEVPIEEITLTCNPHYRYGKKAVDSEELVGIGQETVGSKENLTTNPDLPYDPELEKLLLTDTMKEFISYSVGCMFGRYSLDKPGLILANQGETLADYLAKVTQPTFEPEEDNVIPILDGDWFVDDITERFKKFLQITFGKENYEDNLAFIEKAIGKDIRKYFLKDFYNDHVKRYKKRPIYWMFSSPRGSFNAVIYMHRYRPDTVSVVLNDYLREFRAKLEAQKSRLDQISISASISAGDKTKALNESENIKRMINELEEYEHDILYPLATKQIEIDLDDGVKVNYAKFYPAVKKIKGIEPLKED